MIVKLIIFVALLFGVVTSIQAVKLSEEDMRDFKALQKISSAVSEISSKVKEELKEKTMEWVVSPKRDSIATLEELLKSPDTPWTTATDIYPKSFFWEKDPSMASYAVEDITAFLAHSSFKEELFPFLDLIAERKKNGTGLVATNPEHFEHCLTWFEKWDTRNRRIMLGIAASESILNKFSCLYNTVSLFICQNREEEKIKTLDMQASTIKDFFDNHTDVDPSLRKATGTFEDNFIRLQLFTRAAIEVFSEALNTCGNIGKLYALKFSELGDDSLEKEIPKIPRNPQK